ncbi:hypothetical protein [Marispirochaeta sp.]|jgi:hypothetical protein|uniref:hypothetical protein n=1 Tax=Marispirochaeta sp. TaxID=2038653 RepID=UPI0029C833A2|nr:hypothetical protein [Marispirochaeta sp.]
MEWDEFVRIFSAKTVSLQKHLIPLYRMNYAAKRPEFVGTSVYCLYGKIRFVLTARHVFKQIIPDRPWFQYSENEMRELQFEKYIIANDNDLDVGVVVIENDIPLFNPISYTYFGTFQDSKEYQHLLVGYPGSSTKRSTRHNQRIKFQAYLTTAASNEEYNRLKVDRTKKLIVSFKKEKVYNEEHNLITFPNPNGMSGGAVFQFNENNHNQMYLVGVMTDWDVNRKNAIIATRIECIDEFFRI